MSRVSWEDLGRLSYFSCTTLIYKHILEKLQHQSENLCTKKKVRGFCLFNFLFVCLPLSLCASGSPSTFVSSQHLKPVFWLSTFLNSRCTPTSRPRHHFWVSVHWPQLIAAAIVSEIIPKCLTVSNPTPKLCVRLSILPPKLIWKHTPTTPAVWYHDLDKKNFFFHFHLGKDLS